MMLKDVEELVHHASWWENVSVCVCGCVGVIDYHAIHNDKGLTSGMNSKSPLGTIR